LDVSTWQYKSRKSDDFRYIGPMAQDFHKYFSGPLRLGSSDVMLYEGDVRGVMLAGVKGLDLRTRKMAEENNRLKKRVDSLESEIEDLKKQMSFLINKIENEGDKRP